MTEQHHYIETGTAEERTTCKFTDDESRQVYEIAEWYAALCEANGNPAPPDPMRALLQCCRWMIANAGLQQAMAEQAAAEAEGRKPN